MAEGTRIDTVALVRSVQEETARRRAAGAYPAELLARLRAAFEDDDEAPQPPEALAVVESARPLRSGRRLGRAIVTGKRVTRRLLAWYVAPIAEDQTQFNLALLRDLRAIEERVGRLETPFAEAARIADESGDLARSARLAALLAEVDASAEIVSVGDPWIGDALRDAGRLLTARGERPLSLLAGAGAATADVVVLAGVLPMLGPGELLRVMPSAWRVLRPGGALVADSPRPPEAVLDPGVVHPAYVRWTHRETVALLCGAAGFEQPRVVDASEGNAWPWELHVALRPR